MKRIALLLIILIAGLHFINAQTYTISGTVYDENNNHFQGVELTDGVTNVLTDASGNYSFTELAGWSGTITPSYTGYAFIPPPRTYTNISSNYSNQEYFGTQIILTISGTIALDDDTPISGVFVNFYDQNSTYIGQAETNSTGFYSKTVDFGFSGHSEAVKAGYTFDPTQLPYSDVTASLTGEDYTGSLNSVNISGTIEENGIGLEGVLISFSNGGGDITTASDGTYTHEVPYNYSGIATPDLDGYSFDPPYLEYFSQIVNATNQDYDATIGGISISGTIALDDDTPISGVFVNFYDQNSTYIGQTETNSAGFYSKTVDFGFSGHSEAVKAGYTFFPTQLPYSDVTTSLTGEDYTGSLNVVNISGTIEEDGVGLGGVLITFSNGGGDVTTNGDGTYTHEVPYNYSGIATPDLDGYSFDPPYLEYFSQIVNATNQDYDATIGGISISGTIALDDDTPISGVFVNFYDQNSTYIGQTETNSTGFYSKTVDFGFSGHSEAVKAGYAFDPTQLPYTDVTASLTGEDYTGSLNSVNISGTIEEDGVGLGGVLISFSNSGGNITTASDGTYTHEVPYNYSGIATPDLDGYSFDPPYLEYFSQIVNATNQDYDATIGGISISGTISLDDGAPIQGVFIKFYDQNSTYIGQTETNSTGFYSKTVDFGFSGHSEAVKAGYAFDPTQLPYTDVTASLTGEDYTGSLNSVNISGTIEEDGVGLGGVLISFSNGGGNITTASDGTYTHEVPYNYSGIATPDLDGYSFDPPFTEYFGQIINATNQDYDATIGGISISGTISLGDGTPISGVFVNFYDQNSTYIGQTETNSAGFYSKTVDFGFSGHSEAVKSGYTFDPTQLPYTDVTASITGEDYTGSLNVVNISGTIEEDGVGLGGVLISFSNGGGNITTASDGTYTHEVPYNYSGIATPDLDGYSFDPPYLEYFSQIVNATNQDYDATLGGISISGTISLGDGTPISGVFVNFYDQNNIYIGQTETNSTGFYSKTVDFGFFGHSEAVKAGYTFFPTQLPYTDVTTSLTGEDYTGSLNSVNISGTIEEGGVGLGGVLISFSNGGGNVATNGDGTYTHEVPYNYSGIATPDLDGYSFDPPFIEYFGQIVNATNQYYEATLGGISISGTISLDDGTPISGVFVNFYDQNSTYIGQTETNSTGFYSKTVDFGFSGHSEAVKSGYTFDPTQLPYTDVTASITGEDYTGSLNSVNISGTIEEGGVGLEGVLISFSNGGGNITTASDGTYTHEVPYNYSGIATPDLDGYSFDPPFIEYFGQIINATNHDYDAILGGISISGTISLDDGAPIQGVFIKFYDQNSTYIGQTETNSTGFYSKTVDFGFSGHSEAVKVGYTFDPTQFPYTDVTASLTGEDYIGSLNSVNISGTIEEGGVGLEGVLISFSNGGGNVVTIGDGTYIHDVPYNYSGIATPDLDGYSFDPPFTEYFGQIINATNQDYDAILGGISISGTISLGDGTPIPGVFVKFYDQNSIYIGQSETNSNGFYSQPVDFGFSGTATPEKDGYSFELPTISFINIEENSINNDFVGEGSMFELSGRVTRTNGDPIDEVKINIGTNITSTNENGEYSYLVVYNWTGQISAEKQLFSFFPGNIPLTNVREDIEGLDFTGSSSNPLSITFAQYTFNICNYDTINLDPIVEGGGTTDYEYKWESNPEGFERYVRDPEIIPVPGIDTVHYIFSAKVTGQEWTTDTVMVITRVPPVAVGIIGPYEVCRNQAGVIYSTTQVNNNEFYEWSLPNGGSHSISGEFTPRVVIDWNSQPDNYPLVLYTINKYPGNYQCVSDSSQMVLVTSSGSPGQTDIFYKKVGSLLICQDETADYYRWGKSKQDDLNVEEIISDNDTTRYISITISDTALYYYWVDNWFENGELCKSRSYFNGSPVSIDDLSFEEPIIVFPNPTTGILNIKVTSQLFGKGSIQIFNLNGKRIYSKDISLNGINNKLKINMGYLPKGIYFLKFVTTDKTSTSKIIKY